jgi:hypothetical protein
VIAIGEYVMRIIPAAIFVSILQMILPGKGAVPALLRLGTGIFMIIVAIEPLVNVRIDDTVKYFTDIETDASSVIASAQAQTDNEIAEVIKDRAEAYISGIALNYGADVQVSIEVENESPYLPERVCVTGAVSPAIRSQLSAVLEKEFHLPKEAQVWISAG